MSKRKENSEHYQFHWEHTANLYHELGDYLRFMVHDGNIEQPTYELMTKRLDELFNQYRDIYQDFIED